MKEKSPIRVALGLSGGVDSSVAAALLLEQGYEITGVYITCWSRPGCRSEEDRKDALDIAMQLSIPFVHLDFQQAYKDKVYEYMIREYEAGRTPNPDVMCNREIKFGLFYDWAMQEGYDFIATGHYAQIREMQNAKYVMRNKTEEVYESRPACRRGRITNHELVRSKDEHKDQTYFLYQLRQEQLKHILFPIGHLTKAEVREEAEKRGLLTAKKPDSVGICFIGELPMRKFLEERIKPREGDILFQTNHLSQTTSSTPCRDGGVRLRACLGSDSSSDVVVGKHRGAWFYTIGQKVTIDQQKIEGFDKRNLPHFYVVDKDIKTNVLYAGTEELLYKMNLRIREIHFINNKLQMTNPLRQGYSEASDKLQNLTVRIRHTGKLIKVESLKYKDESIDLELAEPVRAPAPGQAAVIYEGEMCLGGGVLVDS